MTPTKQLVKSPLVEVDLAKLEQKIKAGDTDPYKTEASRIFEVPKEQVTPAQRNFTKLWLYHKMYNPSIKTGLL